MSASGTQGAISPESLFRTIRQGLTFKQHKNVTDFTRSHILPDKTLDVTRIENDFREYQRIQQLINHAKERLEGFQQVIRLFTACRNNWQAAECYRWVNAEARVCALDLNKEDVQEQLDGLEQECTGLKDKLQHHEMLTDELTSQRDTANLALQGSGNQQRLAELNLRLIERAKEIEWYKSAFKKLRENLIRIEAANLSVIETGICDDLKPGINRLSSVADFDGEDLSNQWPRSQENLAKSLQAAFKLEPAVSELKNHVNILDRKVEGINGEIEELTKIARELSTGKASLKHETLRFIEILKSHNLTARPICDLAEITDSKWQWAIEGFLGVWNREALIVLDAHGSPASNSDLDRSLALYRREKKRDARLRSVKLLNPNKIRKPSRPSGAHTAAALIQSNNPVVENYLCWLLGGVDLVETEQELRSRERAITPDGMIAANGAISGGQRLDFVLFGEQVRKDQAQRLHDQLKEKMQHANDCKQQLAGQKEVHAVLDQALSRLTEGGQTALDSDYYGSLAQAHERHSSLEDQISRLSQNQELAQLKANFAKADDEKNKNDQAINDFRIQLNTANNKIETLNPKIPAFDAKIQEASAQRTAIETAPLIDQAKATAIFEKLVEECREKYQDIQSIAHSKAKSKDSQADKNKENATKTLVALCTTHDIEEKNELLEMPPLQCLMNANSVRRS